MTSDTPVDNAAFLTKISLRRRSIFVLVGIVGVACLLACVIGVSVLLVPAATVPDPATRLQLRNTVQATMLQGVAGGVVLLGAYLTWRQLQLGRLQLLQSLNTSNAQLASNVRAQITGQLSRAIDQLSQARPSVRAGAIYSLEAIARGSAEDRVLIHEILAMYIRSESTWTHHDPITHAAVDPDGDEPALLKVRAPDVQAALTALGRRQEVDGEEVELQSTDLRGCYLGRGNLRNSFLGRAMISHSDLTGTNLSGAWLRRVNLSSAILTDCNLRGAVLRESILRDANLQGVNLCGADLSDADLSGADLSRITYDETTKWPAGFDKSGLPSSVKP